MAINFDRYKTSDFSKDCPDFKDISEKLVNFDQVRKDLWSQLRSVDAYNDTNKTLIEIIDITHYSPYKSIDKLFTEMRQKIFESLLLLINEGHLKIDFNHTLETQFKFKLVFCRGRKEDIKAYDYLRLKIDNLIRPFGYASIGLKL